MELECGPQTVRRRFRIGAAGSRSGLVRSGLAAIAGPRRGGEALRRQHDRPIATDHEHIAETLPKSLTLVTALNPQIGYDSAVKPGKTALAYNITRRDAAPKPGHVWPVQCDRWVVPAAMVTLHATLEGGGG